MKRGYALKFFVFLISFLSYNSFIKGQELVFNSYDYILNDSDTTRIGYLNLNNCSYSLLREIYGGILYPTDITLDSDSIYYHFIPFSWTSNLDNFLWSLEFEPFNTGTGVGQFSEPKEGMTCDRQGNLYLAGESLSRWQNGQITELGSLPPSMYCRGDLTFRKGKLYLSSVNNTLVEVDLDDPMNSAVVMAFPPGTPDIHGLATVNVECGSVETYAVGSIPFGGSIIYRIDFDSWELEEICQYDFFITGLASYDECIFPECILNINLDENNSTQAIEDNDFKSGIACVFPVPISDEDVSVYSELAEIDSIIITLLNAASTGEYLSLPFGANVNISGSNSEKIILTNNGSSTESDFELAIQQALYHNDDQDPINGLREIEFVAYFGPYQSSIATSFIPIIESDIDSDFTINEISCNGLTDGSVLSEPSGGTSPYNFYWNTTETTNAISQLDTGEYFLTITDALGCTKVDSTMVSQPEELTGNIINSGFEVVCNENGTLVVDAIGGTAPYAFMWSNNFQGEINEMLSPGTYSVTIEDINGCQAESAYQLEEGTSTLVEIEVFPCYGENYELQGQSYISDTSFCLNYVLSNGCDSIRCYEIDFYEENTSLFSDEICAGDSLLIFGNYFSNDTILSLTEMDNNGCDSVLIFNLSVFDPIDIQFETNGNLCNGGDVEITANGFVDYEWSNGESNSSITVTTPGNYELTVIDDNGCSGTNSVFVEETELSVNWYSVNPSCFGESDGSIQIDSIIGGESTIATSLNNQAFIQTLSYADLSAGNYTLDIISSNNCTASIEFELTEPDEIVFENEDAYLLLSGESLNVVIETNLDQAEILWTPDDYLDCPSCFENNIQASNSILYEVTVIDINGCSATQFIDVQVEESAKLFVPNVFSPNGDMINDHLKVYGSTLVSRIIDLTIISRNGHIVYNSQNFQADESQVGWDGTFRNQDAQVGVYVLYVKYEDIRGDVETKIYSLTLVR